jgi:hypothetical protein
VLQVPTAAEGLVPDGAEEEDAPALLGNGDDSESDDDDSPPGLTQRHTDTDLKRADLASIPEVVQQYADLQARGGCCKHCSRPLSGCYGVTSALMTELINARYDKKELRTCKQLVAATTSAWLPGDTKHPTGYVSLQRGVCLCFEKLMVCLCVKKDMRQAVLKSLRAPLAPGASPWSGATYAQERPAPKQDAICTWLSDTIDISYCPTDGPARQVAPPCLCDLHEKYEAEEKTEVDPSHFCKTWHKWLGLTGTVVRAFKTVEGALVLR